MAWTLLCIAADVDVYEETGQRPVRFAQMDSASTQPESKVQTKLSCRSTGSILTELYKNKQFLDTLYHFNLHVYITFNYNREKRGYVKYA
jgi:hypothetical protein